MREPLAAHLERRLAAFVELEQGSLMRSHMSDGVAVLLSRIDRLYAHINPVDFADLCVRAQMLGERRRHPEVLRPFSAALCRTDFVASSCRALMATVPYDMGRFAQLACFREAFRSAAEPASLTLSRSRQLPWPSSAGAALGMLRASRRGDGTGVMRIVWIDEGLHAFVSGTMARDIAGLFEHATNMAIESAEEEAKYVADSKTPEAQKKQRVESAKAKGLHWRLWRPRKRCVGFSSNRWAARTSDQVGAMLTAHWSPAFTEREREK